MKLKDEVLWEMGFVPPDDPADTDVGKTEFVARGVDRDNTREAEVPRKFGLEGLSLETDTTPLKESTYGRERCNECSGCSINYYMMSDLSLPRKESR